MREHETRVTVRFCEVDTYGVAWHGHYLAWMEMGRNALAAEFGLGVSQLAECGFLAPVIDLALKYRRPARFNEELIILTSARRMDTATLAFDSRILGADGSLRATGRTVHALTDMDGILQYKLPEVVSPRLAAMLAWTESP